MFERLWPHQMDADCQASRGDRDYDSRKLSKANNALQQANKFAMKKQQTRSGGGGGKLSDPMIVPRVKNYLAENVDKTFVDVGQMARSLRERYREYSSRSENAFCQMVENAYKVVLQSYGLDGASSSEGSEEESDDLELLDDSNRALNDQLLAMYKMQDKKRGSRKEPGEKSNELIDISSDEEGAAPKVPKMPKLNDQITITPHVPDEVRSKISIPISNSSLLEPPHKSTPRVGDRKRKPDTPKSGTPRRRQTVVDNTEKTISKITFDDVGGISEILTQICDLVLHMKHPEVYKQLGIKSPRGALLHGPPGTGKTLLASAISGKLKLPMISVAGTELVGGVSGESEERIRYLFEKAIVAAPCILFIDEIDAVCGNRLNAQKDMERRMVAQLLASIDGLSINNSEVLILAATNNPDLLDPALRRAGRLEQEIALGIPSLTSRKEILGILCKNIAFDDDIDMNTLAQLTPGFVGADLQALVNKACTYAVKRVFKGLQISEKTEMTSPEVEVLDEKIVAAESNIPNGEKENTPVHDETKDSGDAISEVLADDKAENDISNPEPSTTTEGPTNGDEQVNITEVNITSTVHETTELIPKVVPPMDPKFEILSLLEEKKPYTPDQLKGMAIRQDDFLEALKTTKPCAIREGIVTVPDVTWADVGSLNKVRKELQLAVIAPVKYPDQLKKLGLMVPSGILLCGPPGCGKTLLAKAVANEAGINFISVKGPELLNMYVGESERAVRTCFQRARNSAPCVIFFDEFDSLCPRRSQGENNGASRVVNQLLTEMDGIESREGVFILAASNRPDIIDPAVLRPGRLDRVIYVGMPQQPDRLDILRKITKRGTKPPLGPDLDLNVIACLTENYSGADLAGLVRQAATQALTQHITDDTVNEEIFVTSEHFREALGKCKPSVSMKEQQHYEKLRIKYAAVSEDTMDVETDGINEESMDTV